MAKLRTLDVTGEHCPMTFVRVKIELAKLGPGDELAVLLREGEPLENVPKSAVAQGYGLVSVSEVGNGVHKVVIRR